MTTLKHIRCIVTLAALVNFAALSSLLSAPPSLAESNTLGEPLTEMDENDGDIGAELDGNVVDKTLDVGALLGLAEDDRKAGRYDNALKKYQWFHNNATQYNEAMFGVRLSFALDGWLRLAKEYPPAMQAMQDEALAAEERVLAESPDYLASFHDLVAINETLNQNDKTIALYKRKDASKSNNASQMLVYAKRQLLQAQEYALIRKHTDPRESLRMIFMQYDSIKNNADETRKASMEILADEMLINEAGNLVALLSVLDESRLAGEIERSVLRKSDNPRLKQTLASAMKGMFPAPRY